MSPWPCCYYSFNFFPKGIEVKYEKENRTRQFIPFAQILTLRYEYLYDDKVGILTIIARDNMKFSYPFKQTEEAEKIYEKIIENI